MREKDTKQGMEENSTAKEAQLLHGGSDQYGIYQLKDDPALHHLYFEGTKSLRKLGIIKDSLSVIKPENYELVYVGKMSKLSEEYGRLPTREDKLETIYEKFNINRPKDYRGHSLSVSDVVVLHINGENSAHYVDSFGFTALPDFACGLENEKEQEPELAFRIANRFISIQETEGGYDYSIIGTDFKVIDGGVYDNPDVTIREAFNDILEDLREDSSGNGAGGNISDRDRLIPIDYDGLMEKVEDAERIASEKAVSQPPRSSLRARLTEKKAEMTQLSQKQEKGKNSQIEM